MYSHWLTISVFNHLLKVVAREGNRGKSLNSLGVHKHLRTAFDKTQGTRFWCSVLKPCGTYSQVNTPRQSERLTQGSHVSDRQATSIMQAEGRRRQIEEKRRFGACIQISCSDCNSQNRKPRNLKAYTHFPPLLWGAAAESCRLLNNHLCPLVIIQWGEPVNHYV